MGTSYGRWLPGSFSATRCQAKRFGTFTRSLPSKIPASRSCAIKPALKKTPVGVSGFITIMRILLTSRQQLSLCRLNHRLPWGQAYPEVVQGTAEFHHEIADALLPQADPVFHNATPLDTAV